MHGQRSEVGMLADDGEGLDFGEYQARDERDSTTSLVTRETAPPR